jgi:hypothetical protein
VSARKLHLAEDLRLPLDVITESVGILAVKRAGKSYTAKKIAEQLLHAQQQIVVVDPKGDWWGLRSSADGQGPGFPIVILGGEHGDVPLEPGAGELVAQMVVNERVSVVLDLSELRKHQVATFMTAFLETVYRLKAKEEFRTPLMLIIDEADAIASQKPQKGEERMLGAAEDIVRRGGQRGIGVMLVTQRAAVLNKNVLTQVGILILLRTTGSQDIDAIDEWIKKHSQEESRALVMESIAALPRGTAWVWAPGWPDEHGIFKRIEVSPCETFNSGATPKVGERRALPKTLADVDLDAFRREMAATIEKAKAEDPVELRKQLAAVQRELVAEQKRKTPAAKVQTSVKDPAAAAERAQARVDVHALQQRVKQLTSALERLMKFVVEIHAQDFFKAGGPAVDQAAITKALEGAAAQIVRLLEANMKLQVAELEKARRQGGQLVAQITKLLNKDVQVSVAVKHNEPFTVTPQARAPAPRPSTGSVPLPDGLGNVEQRILDQLAELEAIGLTPTDKQQLALFSGYTNPRSGGFSEPLGRLVAAGLIASPSTGKVVLTDAGRAIARPIDAPVTTDALQERILAKLDGPRAKLLRELITLHPSAITKAELAERCGYTNIRSGGFSEPLGSLSTLGLVEYPTQGEVRAADALFLEAAPR